MPVSKIDALPLGYTPSSLMFFKNIVNVYFIFYSLLCVPSPACTDNFSFFQGVAPDSATD
jgi:hypothetical protein